MNSKDEYISIKELAEITGKSQQSIYKRLNKENNPLKVFVKETSQGLKVHKDALRVVYKIEQKFDNEVVQPSLTTSTTEEKEQPNNEQKQTAELKVIDILQKELEEQRKNNETKDQQIKELTEMLQQSQQMLSNEQKLNAINTQRILQLEESTTTKKRKKWFFNLF